MYVLTQTRLARNGRLADAIARQLEVKKRVKELTNRDITVGAAEFGNPRNLTTLATIVESRAEWFELKDQIGNDPGILAIFNDADVFEGPPDVQIRMVVHGHDLPGADQPHKFTQVWTAQIDQFRFDAALAWAVKVSEHVTNLTGVNVWLLADGYGQFGTLTWMATLSSAAQTDAMNEAMLADDDWRKMLAEAGGLFIPSTVKAWLTRVVG